MSSGQVHQLANEFNRPKTPSVDLTHFFFLIFSSVTTGSTMAPSDATSELVAKQSSNAKGLYPQSFNAKNIPSFLQTPYKYSLSSKNLQQKRKKAREATSIGGTTAIARTLMMQGLYLFYRTPIKVI